MNINLKKIRIDGGTQPRSEIDYGIVNEYADAMTEGAKFPAIVVFNDGANYWLADGFHRYHASKKLGFYEIECEVKSGTKRDAVLYSVGANSSHGLRRSNADKRKAVLTLLQDEEWSKWSDREIADRCGVSNKFVSNLRNSLTVNGTQLKSKGQRRYTNKHGTTATMKTENIGKRNTTTKIQYDPEYISNEQKHIDRVRPERKGIGLEKAHEAISVLKDIPQNDDLLQEGYDTVIRWINDNR
jgi:hypothetical protein